MTSNSSIFQTLSSLQTPPQIQTTNGDIVVVTSQENICIQKLSISSTFFVPQLYMNLVSIGQLVEKGLVVTFASSSCVMLDCSTRKLVGTWHKVSRLFLLISLLNIPIHILLHLLWKFIFICWHKRLGHVSFLQLSSLVNKGALCVVPTIKELSCLYCKLSQQLGLSFSLSYSTSFAPFEIIYSDV